jgi:hypothetical protein
VNVHGKTTIDLTKAPKQRSNCKWWHRRCQHRGGRCQRFRSGQLYKGSTPVVYLFGGVESRAKNSKVAHEHTKHKEHDELILVQASGE